MSKEFALSAREDVSRFMVHLTRDDRQNMTTAGAQGRTYCRFSVRSGFARYPLIAPSIDK
jgi:hypothetical protein